MTMTDDELNEQLRAVGEYLDRRSIAYVAPSETPARRVFPAANRLVAMGAAVLLVTAGAVLALRAADNEGTRTETATDGSSTTTPPTAAQSTSSSVASPDFVGIDLCRQQLREFEQRPELVDNVPVPDPVLAEVVLIEVPNHPSQIRVLLVDETSGFTCRVHRGANEDATIDGVLMTGLQLGPEPASDSGGFLDMHWTSETDAGDIGPGTWLAVGRVGEEIVDVTGHLTDGTDIPGAVANGWFVVDGDIPPGVPLFRERITWTLQNGDEIQMISGEEVLDDCVSDPDCVRRNVADVQDEAARRAATDEPFVGRAATDEPFTQAAVVADGIVTVAEANAAKSAYVTCLQDAGIDTYPDPTGRGGVATTGDSLSTDAGHRAQGDCWLAHIDLVEDLLDIQDAQDRLNSDRN